MLDTDTIRNKLNNGEYHGRQEPETIKALLGEINHLKRAEHVLKGKLGEARLRESLLERYKEEA